MNAKALRAAVTEAKRFLSKAHDAIEMIEAGEHHDGRRNGAVKRASMDLTRALADMRRPE
jgi:hypothetical protein